jgi:putative heme-binding domain-containing protein
MTPAYLAAMQTTPPTAVLNTLVELSKQYDGKDRWYLEALGIAARGREDALYGKLREQYPGKWNPALGRLLWEFRPKAALPYLTAALNDASLAIADRMQALDMLAAMQWLEAAHAVEALIVSGATPPELAESAFKQYGRQLFSIWMDSRKSPALAQLLKKALATPAMQMTAVDLADALGDPQYTTELLALVKSSAAAPELRAAALSSVARTRNPQYRSEIENLAASGPVPVRVAAVRALGIMALENVEAWAETVIFSDAPNEVRSEALRVLARSPKGLTMILDRAEKGAWPPELKVLATGLVNGTAGGRGFGGGRGATPPDPAVMAAIRARAAKVLPPMVGTTAAPIPSLRTLDRDFPPNVAGGRRVFETEGACGTCHSLGGPKLVGPDLSAIGEKFSKQGLLDAILNPNEAIAPEYQVWNLKTTTQGEVVGILIEDTPERVMVNTGSGDPIRLKPSEITRRTPSRVSIMPEGLLNRLSPQQIADLLEFLTTLKMKK